MIIILNEVFLSRVETAKKLNISTQTLANLASKKKEPIKSIKISNKIYYKECDVNKYLKKILGEENV